MALVNPVLFLVFNRPKATAQVFEAIRAARPPRLYVACDGARNETEGENDLVEEVRRIATNIDWTCKLITLFRPSNLGCKKAVSEAVTWFFEQEEQGIILEDDCLPSPSFFLYCDELLETFAEETRVFLISGYNCEQEWRQADADYFFSHTGGIWGWASWRRAWEFFDGEMTGLADLAKSNHFEKTMGWAAGKLRKKQLLVAMKKMTGGTIDSWAYPWGYSRNAQAGLACVPTVSLITNIGFGPGATHTTNVGSKKVVAKDISSPIRHNTVLCADKHYDFRFLAQSMGLSGFFRKMISRITQ